MDGQDYQRGSIENDGNRQRNGATVQNMESKTYLGHFVSHTVSQLLLIEGNIEGRISRRQPITTWITDLTNITGGKYYKLKRAAENRKSIVS